MIPIKEPLKIKIKIINKISSNIWEKKVFRTIELIKDSLGKLIDFMIPLYSFIIVLVDSAVVF